MGLALSRLLRVVYYAFVAFTLKRRRGGSYDSGSVVVTDLEKKSGTLILRCTNNMNTWFEGKERFLHESGMTRTRIQSSCCKIKLKNPTRKPEKQQISPPRASIRNLSSIPFSWLESSSRKLQHSVRSRETPGTGGEEIQRESDYISGNWQRTLSTIPEEEETLSGSGCSSSILEETGTNQNGVDTLVCNLDVCSEKSFDCETSLWRSPQLRECVLRQLDSSLLKYSEATSEVTSSPLNTSNPSSPPSLSHLFGSSFSQCSTASPKVSSLPPNLFSSLPAYPFNPQSAVSGLLYDAPISSVHATILGRASSIPLPFFSTAYESSTEYYKQNLARKKLQTHCSGLHESIVVNTSFHLASDIPITAWTPDEDTEAELSEMVYPDLFRFSMYLNHLDFGEDPESGNLGSSAGHSKNTANVEESGRLSIPPGTATVMREDHSQSEDVYSSKMFARTFGTGLSGNQSLNSSSTPPEDVYRSPAYSRPVSADKKQLGLGQWEDSSGGVRRTVLCGAMKRSGKRSGKTISAPAKSLDGNVLSYHGSMSSSYSLASVEEEGDSQARSFDWQNRSPDSSVAERLRDACWDKMSFSWNEQDFLGMLKHSP
ncbi:hypothetical protein L218DRAFT_956147 [Marasmius fiardii PR-910]|nr:hypothetical protein L218DRAFT_956147 [Marasmius fiardii PR-910]